MFLHLLTILLIFFTAVYFYFARKANYWQERNVKGPKPLPILGNLWETMFTAQNILEERWRLKYGPVYGTMQGVKPVITIGDPELLKQVLIADFNVFMNHRPNVPCDPFLSRMLNELQDDEWRRVRAITSPAFTIYKLKKMQKSIDICIENTFKHLDTVVNQKSEIEVKHLAVTYTLDTIATCVFGMYTNGFENPNDEFIMKAKEFGYFKLWRLLSSLILPSSFQAKYDFQLFPKELVKYFMVTIRDTIKQRRQITKKRPDFVSLLLEAEYEGEEIPFIEPECNQLSENELMANCLIFFLAGYETTASFINYFLYVLAIHPKVQEKLHKEISEYFSHSKDHDFESLNTLPYFDAVVSETLRHYPPLFAIEHICGMDYKLGNTGITIEKGTTVNIPYYALHHDPKLFPNPHEFIPERFLPENKDNIKPYSYIPFGLGPRNCIGQLFANLTSKIFIAKLVNKFQLIKTNNTPETPQFNGKFVFLSCKPMYVSVKRRQQ